MLVFLDALIDFSGRLERLKSRSEELSYKERRYREILSDCILSSVEAIKVVRNSEDIESRIAILKSYLEEGLLDEETAKEKISECVVIIEHIIEHIRSNRSPYYRQYHEHYYRDDQKYCLDEITMQIVCSSFRYNRNINILDPCCIYHSNLTNIKSNCESVTSYAAVREQTANRMRNYIDNIAVSSNNNDIYIKGSQVTNSAFDVVLMQPAIEQQEYKDVHLRREREIFRQGIKYLRPGGILFLVIPFYRIYNDLKSDISKNISDLQIRKALDFEQRGTVIIIGKKTSGAVRDNDIHNTLVNMYDTSSMKSVIQEYFEDISFPIEEREIKTFRGQIVDEGELRKIISKSTALKDFWEEQRAKSLHEQVGQPPLPFNEGRIGLVLSSGFLDGVLHEEEGYAHIVKGRVRRFKEEREEEDGDLIKLYETESNRVEINLFLPDGTRKTLA